MAEVEGGGGDGHVIVVIREYNHKTDNESVEQVESRCEVGPNGELSLYTDLLGDPICRVRNSPAFLMLVTEIVSNGGDGSVEIVGMIRGCIKTVTCGQKLSRNSKTGEPPKKLQMKGILVIKQMKGILVLSQLTSVLKPLLVDKNCHEVVKPANHPRNCK